MTAPIPLALAVVLQPLNFTDVSLRFLSVLLLIAINAFFVTAEFSIVSVRRSRINQLVDAGDIQARTVQSLQQSIDRLLSTTQLGITLSSLALGWIGESSMAVIVSMWITQLPLPQTWIQPLSHSASIPISFLLIAYLQIVLGELCPKSLAMRYSEEIARFLGPFSLAIARFFNPFIWILNQSTQFLLRLIGVQYTGQGWYNQVTPEELQLIIATSSESSGLEQEERELLSNVFEFAEVSAEEVMVRRPSMITLPIEATVRDLLVEVAESGHSRFPITGESLDDICGFVHLKELAEPLVQGTLNMDSPLKSWIQPARFVPEYTSLGELLTLMQRDRQHMVLVVDEFGGTAGLVTIQDLVTQIIGETEESDEEQPIQTIDENTFMIQAQMNLEEINDRLDLNLPVIEEYQTLGGFLFYQWQKIPQPGETLQYANYELTVVSVEGPRLHQIRVHRIETPAMLDKTKPD
ncbi:hemolysin family protein [Leptolyngbya boryana NIES-2135]|jgi:CBS domain containing-hemolysin-like protein|uniref:Hemolysin family protein n=1 Tax=Leptolyngbya boryana NIES-2135 TaxID=1973484 RepID=A0A1Z4JHK5_LEPBY|nr:MULTISPECIES: hemolysin family protein [Leptolyngbya]BAY56007.1 hemolysin family protein [Leptolyngbya boryana NIES-2135]MBD1859685.1 HlyC/CorC family transporter [Leptolyngbya sp. FACHB-1624]MBD2366121.1 HlyC/CorC family transporter [Leptolyngbya sp. FACHB-161]MBD2372301.1 HlyC/CorC family transporter [Leptolyngbya sp. FACHB-238]MBD2396724.1 HlyC/CorC family transporter [Leptolyngbya sp. FACHB-239]